MQGYRGMTSLLLAVVTPVWCQVDVDMQSLTCNNSAGYVINDDYVALAKGCYNSPYGHSAYPESTMVSFRSHIDWNQWVADGSARELILRCANAALQSQAPGFGVEFFGECYMGDNPDLSLGEVTSPDCKKCEWDVGGNGAVLVYFLYRTVAAG